MRVFGNGGEMVPRRKGSTPDREGLLADQSGVSAIEFSVFAAILVPILLLAFDVGFAIHQRMIMDAILRLGMQEAMRFDPLVTSDERGVLINTALTEAVGALATGRMDPLAVSVAGPLCHCPEALETQVPCDSICAAGAPHEAYALSAQMTYRSLFVGDLAGLQPIVLRSRAWVQVYTQVVP